MPSQLVYNDLNGEEIRHVLAERFQQLLAEVPYLQRHITLPRLKMTLQVHLDSYSDQPTPQRQTISDSVEIYGDGRTAHLPVFPYEPLDLQEVVSAAPGRGGKTPDQIRDEHGLSIPTPMRGPIGIEDVIDQTVEGRRMSMSNGAVIDRTGSAPERSGATVVVQDFGQAGLARGEFKRDQVVVGNKAQRDGGPVAPVRIQKDT